jgi:ankyrin repeat protein
MVWSGQCAAGRVTDLLPRVDVNERNDIGITALHVAVGNRCYDVAALLLLAGADPNAQDHRGRSPIFSALGKLQPTENTSLLVLLIRAGADLDLADNNGAKPRSFLQEKFFVESGRAAVFQRAIDIARGLG